jgi:cyanoexosortase A
MLKPILAMTGKMEKFREVNFLNYTFLTLFVFGLVTSTHLTLYWRVEQNLNDSFFQLLLYASVIFHIYERRNKLVFASQFPANLIGCLLIVIPYISANFVVKEISVSWYFLPLVSATGLALLASGFPGIKQFKRELAVIGIFPLIFVFVKLLTMLISIQALSAQITSFVLWYLGFDSTIAGTIIYVNGGAIDVLLPCTGMSLLIMLLKFSFVLAILFPALLKNIYLPFILSVVFSLVFSISRLMIMALVVKDKPAFEYWHGSQGGDIFTVLTFLAFGGVILFLSPNNQTPSSLTTAPPQQSQPVSWIMVVTGISLVIILLNFLVNPQAGLSTTSVYRFPSEIPLPGWQFVASTLRRK